MSGIRKPMRGALHDAIFWHDEGGNTVRVAPSDDGGIWVWVSDYGHESGPRLCPEEIRDMCAHLLALCDEIDRVAGPRGGLTPEAYEQVCEWAARRAGEVTPR
ncbi:MAG TPA: hypothetical protein VJT49_00810 [Amycolatopsis sp.]|uniref:hypothetical protein n=1 Tax=Amycolatopsis sp. TaxID=37632 RepID=UPI002B4679FB|nr:hypothetical protein [Amycolatopsis sp.]HKS43656.1 hypothetical protein [Amycolatopsis sp.]